jgi:putative spermidine/putrescine transport system permease protein
MVGAERRGLDATVERVEVALKLPQARSALSAPLMLAAPALLLLAFVFIGPILLLLARSIFDPAFTLKYYVQLIQEPHYLGVFWISLKIAIASTLICLALGYPSAYYLSKSRGTLRAVLLGVILLPFWTNILVRCYAWIILLQTHGAVNQLLKYLGLITEPLPMVFNFTGVMVGMVHYLLPPTILILDSVMRTVDPRLVVAAENLGATPRQAFFRVFVPLTLPGIRAAAMLIFIMGLGFFVTPALLGGRRELTIATLINFEFSEMINWGLGAALSAVLLALTLIGLYVYYVVQPRDVSGKGRLHA